jgi:hypothetical protein
MILETEIKQLKLDMQELRDFVAVHCNNQLEPGPIDISLYNFIRRELFLLSKIISVLTNEEIQFCINSLLSKIPDIGNNTRLFNNAQQPLIETTQQ